MKKVLVLFLVFVPWLPLFALDYGFAADAYFNRDSEKFDSSKASEITLELMPGLVMMLSPQLEVRPFAVIGLDIESDSDGISGAILEDYTALNFGAGAGLYYHFIQREIISVCTGPKATIILYLEPSGTSAIDYDSYFELSIAVALPVYLDVKLTDKLFFRTGIEITGIEFYTYTEELGGVKSGDGYFTIWDYYLGGFVPYFGFYFML